MRTAPLASTGSPTPTRDDLVFRSDVEALVNRIAGDMERRLQQYVAARMPQETKAPVVNVTATSEPTPIKVDVDSPNVTVEPQIDVAVEGLGSLAAEIAGLRADVKDLFSLLTETLKVLSQPVRKTVERDQAGWITEVVETR